MEEKYGYVFNIMMIGDIGVGKTSIFRQYKERKFSFTKLPTLGVDFCIKTHKIDGNDIKLQIWDTCGQERFRSIIRTYYRRADAIVVVYDIGRAETFNNVPYWLGEVKEYAEEGVHCLLVGNKSDLPDKKDTRGKKDKEVRKVATESGRQFAEENGMPFMESTAKNWGNVNELFVQLARTLLEKQLTPHKEASDVSRSTGQDSNMLDIVEVDKNQLEDGRRCCF